MMQPADAQNILGFMERVQTTGIREAQEYLRCCGLLVAIVNSAGQQPAEPPAAPSPPSPPGRPALEVVPPIAPPGGQSAG